MPGRKRVVATPQQKEEPVKEKKYPTWKLLKSKHLKDYQPDFARVILTEPGYTVSEAKKVLDQVLKPERKEGN